ncbi:MAG TPA: alkaline phosphatase family protein [Actinomycetota bacterium]|nr:alkaline phosphatase family protein [Actinomycetota bacterium]
MTQAQKVVYVIVDGMSTEAFERVVGSGAAPGLAFLKERGSYVRDAVAIFPTITPCASASLVTGERPHRHRIPGMCWYDRDAERFVNYGQSPRAAVIEGVGQIVEDVLVNLNERHLSAEVSTIHEDLDRRGLRTASINFMVFRGPHRLELRPNLLERLLFRKRLPKTLVGPVEHYFADIVNGEAGACSKLISTRGLEKRIKATDAWASCVTRELLERDAADMILFYLHENDHHSHRVGPDDQVESLAEADRHLRHVLETFGSWEETADRVGFVVTSDHSQSPVSDDSGHIMRLDEILDDFSNVKPNRGKEPFGDKDVAVAGNGRVGFVYLNEAKHEALSSPVIEALRAHQGVDQVIWRAGADFFVANGRSEVCFQPSRDGGVEDERGGRWNIRGDLGAVSGVVEDGKLRTPEYPLAFWRVASALRLDRCGDAIVTAKLGWEFTDLAGGDHRGGGDHGSLHVQDSTVPFISTLAEPPLRPSTIDAAPHIVGHFDRVRSA